MDQTTITIFKSKLVDALRAFDLFCEAHDLSYFACAGTALGAVRHGGIIPWDDDIDVMMMREDYNRLISLREELYSTHYRIVNLGDDGYIYPFAKFYDSNTTLIEFQDFPSCVIGVYIDIFPLDSVGNDIISVKEQFKRYHKLSELFLLTYRVPHFHIVASCLYHFDLAYLYNMYTQYFASDNKKAAVRDNFIKYDRSIQSFEGDGLLCFSGMYKFEKELIKREWFESYKYIDFEGYKIRVNAKVHEYLSNLYGDYMTPPPIEQQKSHHFHYYLNLKEGLDYVEILARVKKGEYTVI